MKVLSVFVFIFLLSSCGNLNSIYRSRSVDSSENRVFSIDAKQRMSFVMKNKYCSEPSPDAFSVYSASLDAKASKPEAFELGLKLATGETGSTLGIRTEVIQLMRDAMYRLCEAHISGALTRGEYFKQIQKYQKSMVTLLAINQITSAVKPPNVILSANGSLASGSNLYEAKLKYDAAVKVYDDETKKLKDKEAEMAKKFSEDDYKSTCTGDGKPADADKTKCAEYDALVKERDAIKGKQALAQTNKSEWKKVLDGEESKINLSTNTSNVITANSVIPQKLTKDEIKIVADTVKELVNSVYQDEINIAKCVDYYLLQPKELEQEIKVRSNQLDNARKQPDPNSQKDSLRNADTDFYDSLKIQKGLKETDKFADYEDAFDGYISDLILEQTNIESSNRYKVCEALVRNSLN